MKKLSYIFILCLFNAFVPTKAEKINFFHMANIQMLNKNIPKEQKVVVLTFDDGPFENSTAKIIKILNKYDVKATFFLVGSLIEKNPELTKLLIDSGHELANHSYSHASLKKLPNEKIKEEITSAQNILAKFGVRSEWFRPPYLSLNDYVIECANQLGLKPISWSLCSDDFKGLSPDELVKHIEKNLHNGAIILLHEHGYRQNTIKALPKIIEMIQTKGYKIITLSQWHELTKARTNEEDPSLKTAE